MIRSKPKLQYPHTHTHTLKYRRIDTHTHTHILYPTSLEHRLDPAHCSTVVQLGFLPTMPRSPPPQDSGSRTLTTTAASTDHDTDQETVAVLRLRAGPSRRRRVVWDEGVVDNEGLGRKSSKSKPVSWLEFARLSKFIVPSCRGDSMLHLSQASQIR